MKFYTQSGIDLHARSMYLCILNQEGAAMVHRNMNTDPPCSSRSSRLPGRPRRRGGMHLYLVLGERYFRFYNTERRHQALNRHTPDALYFGRQNLANAA